MNRQQFEKDLKHLLKQTTMEGIVVVLDVDNFKNINEKYSYAFGDRTLNFIARELTTLLPVGCQMYRLDGDVFALLIPKGTKEIVTMIYENIQMYIGNQFVMEDSRFMFLCQLERVFFQKTATIIKSY